MEKLIKMVLAIICLSFLFMGCSGSDKGCTNIHSDNYDPYATVDDGSCILWYEKYEGNYFLTESCGSATFPPIRVRIVRASNDASIYIQFQTTGRNLFYTLLTGPHTFYIPPQLAILVGGDLVQVAGSGEISADGKTLNAEFFKDDFSDFDFEQCSLTFSKLN